MSRKPSKPAPAPAAIDDPRAEWVGMPEFQHRDLTAGAAFTVRIFLKDTDELAELGRLIGKDLTGRKFAWFKKQPKGVTWEARDRDPA